MNVNEARELNVNIGKRIIELVFADIRNAADAGAMHVDIKIDDGMDDMYDFIIIPELKRLGYGTDTFNGSSSEINTGELYRTLRVRWHPEA